MAMNKRGVVSRAKHKKVLNQLKVIWKEKKIL